jgi:hypothetical protein
MIIKSEEYQPRFKAFLLHNKISIGDTVRMHEYINWINSKCSQFMKMRNISFLNEYNHSQFTQWLFKMV